MLETLELRDFAIVDELEFALSPGLNVLTGETGAGKSIIIDAIELLTGARAVSGMIRGGADSALVQATLSGTRIESCARRLSQGGRHSARIDGELVTVAELSERVGALAAVFGQHAAQELTSRTRQRDQLDRLLSKDHLRSKEAHAAAFERAAAVNNRLLALEELERQRSRKEDTLKHQLSEIDSAAPRVGEDDALRAELTELRNAERLLLAATAAHAALEGAEVNAATLLAQAVRELEAAGRYSQQFGALATDLAANLQGASAVASELERILADWGNDPNRLDAVQARLAQLQALTRKYGPTIADVLTFRASAAAELTELAEGDEEAERLRAELAQLQAELTTLGAELSAARRHAARQLEERIAPLLGDLGMERAQFEVELTESARRHRHGLDDVRFLFSANPGEAPQPLSAIASGGELSRVMLALNLITGTEYPTLVFDEIDAGVGGEAAGKVAALLAQLANQHQVLVVTHLAQVAAYADAHFVVEKQLEGDRTITRVRRVGPSAREAELARMLSGAPTEAALTHARELLTRAGKVRTPNLAAAEQAT